MITKGFIEWYTHKERKKEKPKVTLQNAKISWQYPNKIPSKMISKMISKIAKQYHSKIAIDKTIDNKGK